jgi:hypothetical protein
MINEYGIWANLKAYIYNFGECVLDQILCIADPEATSIKDRYSDFSELNKHFELQAYSESRVEDWKYPFIGVYFIPDYTEECDIKTRVGFSIAFHNVSPSGCDICSRCIGNSSDAMLKFKDAVTNNLLGLFNFSIVEDDNSVTNTNFAKYLHDKQLATDESDTPTDWNRKINIYTVGDPFVSSIRTRDEISYFNIEIDIIASSLNC